MFTVKVVRKNGTVDYYECARVRWSYHAEDQKTETSPHLLMNGIKGVGADAMIVSDGKAYVMNDMGKTVDMFNFEPV